MTTETKSYKTINFVRHITKKYEENYAMNYDEFAAYLRKEGWNNKEFKDDEPIKKMWDHLANSGDDTGEGEVLIDTEIEQDNDHFDDEEWEDGEEEVWDYIMNTDIEEVLPTCVVEGCSKTVIYEGEKCWSCVELAKKEAEKTPEQKEEEAKKKAVRDAVAKEIREQQSAEMKKQADEYREKRLAEQKAKAPADLRHAIFLAKNIFKPKPTGELPPMVSREAMEQTRNYRRCEILAKMDALVEELVEVAKW